MKKVLLSIFGIPFTRTRRIISLILFAIFFICAFGLMFSPASGSRQLFWPILATNIVWLYFLVGILVNSQRKWINWIGVSLGTIAGILLIIILVNQTREYIDRIGNLPPDTMMAFIDPSSTPSQSDATSGPTNLGWPIPQAYQKDAQNFDWWETAPRFDRNSLTEVWVNNQAPTLGVAFDLPAESIPAVASFDGTVREVSLTKTNDEPAISTVSLSNGSYTALYQYLLSDSIVKSGTVKQGDIIGNIAFKPTAIFSKDQPRPGKSKDTLQIYSFLFSIATASGSPTWISTDSFGP